ncbi:hypothetical protein Mapa_015978 [Marchantia paleacea]|nr:hypothetical protein Mapa_015978 [Marchantia paleacea]
MHAYASATSCDRSSACVRSSGTMTVSQVERILYPSRSSQTCRKTLVILPPDSSLNTVHSEHAKLLDSQSSVDVIRSVDPPRTTVVPDQTNSEFMVQIFDLRIDPSLFYYGIPLPRTRQNTGTAYTSTQPSFSGCSSHLSSSLHGWLYGTAHAIRC